MLTMTRLIIILISLSPFPSFSEAPFSHVSTSGCLACHAKEQLDREIIPRLDNRTPNQLYQLLLDFKSGQRKGTVMNRISQGFSDQELKIISDRLGTH